MNKVFNKSQGKVEWESDGLKFIEIIKQEYGTNNCKFSAGMVEGHIHDTCYIAWGKDGDEGGMLLLTPDEVAAIGWVATGVLWSGLLQQRDEIQVALAESVKDKQA